ncbi:MAG TPA: methylated-DNA--[protein]-cysteine S-methyltransferase [Candidatus Dormibacteraeota bacterium]|jgi:O-6-methylguanine DNA methyltransferase
MDLLEKDLRDLGRVRAPEGFANRVLTAVGIVPGGMDAYASLDTPVGMLHVAWSADGISALRLTRSGEDFERWFGARLGRRVVRAPALPERLAAQVEEAIAGRSRRLRFDLGRLSPFEQEVLRKTLEIPRGEVRPYAWVAREIGRPRAVRAVGTALGHNPIPVLIPCHRVVRSDGALGEYSMGGPRVKREILSREGVDASWLEELAARGTRFVGSRTTHVFCLPTCRHARRIQVANRVPLRDETQAREAGFRPCTRCRPALVS